MTDVKIKTKSIYEPIEEDDGVRVLITRYYPRGVKKSHFDIWLRSLSPSPELLRHYKHGLETWENFESRFETEIKSSIEGKNGLQAILSLCEKSDVTLLCYERAGNNCHRYLIKDMLRGHPPSLKPFYA